MLSLTVDCRVITIVPSSRRARRRLTRPSVASSVNTKLSPALIHLVSVSAVWRLGGRRAHDRGLAREAGADSLTFLSWS